MKISKVLSLSLLFTLSACGNKSEVSQGNPSLIAGNYLSSKSENCQSTNCLSLRKEFDHVVSVGKKIYCYWDLKKAATQKDYTKIASDLKNTITDLTTTYEYYLILQRWAGSLQDGHVNAMWGEDLRELESYKVPLRLELLSPGTNSETLIVSSTAADTRDIPVGAVVTKINGDDAMTRLNETTQFSSGSTIRMQRALAANMIFSIMRNREEEKSPVTIEYTFKGETKTATLPRIITLPFNQKTNSDDTPINYSELIQAKILPNNIGYLRVDSFSGGEMATILTSTLKLLSNTKALLIDVRQNGGGNQAGNAIISFLTKNEVNRYSESFRLSDIIMQERSYKLIPLEIEEGAEFSPVTPLKVLPSEKPYGKAAFVLTSSKCFSACDTFVSALKENKLATILGEGTGGGTGTPHSFELQYSGLSFRYSVVQGLTAVSNTLLEGTGTLPDIEIRPTLEERVAKTDLQLVKASNIIAERINVPTITNKDLKDVGIKSQEFKDGYNLVDYNNQIKIQTEI